MGFGIRKIGKGLEIMENGRTVRIKEIEKGQQEMQEKIFQVTKMVTSLKKEKGITEDPSLQDWSAS